MDNKIFIIYNIIKITTVTLQRMEDHRTVQMMEISRTGNRERGRLESKCFLNSERLGVEIGDDESI